MRRRLLGRVKAMYWAVMLTAALISGMILPAIATVPKNNPVQDEVTRFGNESESPPKSPILGNFEMNNLSSKSPTRGGFRGQQPRTTSQIISLDSSDLLQQGKALYEAGKLTEAAQILQQAAQQYQSQGESLKQAAALTNLALVYRQLNRWTDAQQTIQNSLQVLGSPSTRDRLTVLAQTLNIQGNLQLDLGQTEAALNTWQRTETLYQQLKDQSNIDRARLNQAQVLQVMGFYRRARSVLTDLNQSLQSKPESLTRAIVLRSLGDTLQAMGETQQAQQMLKQSLAIAQRLQSSENISAALFSLGNTATAQQNSQTALTFYQQASEVAPTISDKVLAQINQFSVFTQTRQFEQARSLLPIIQSQLDRLSINQVGLYARINFAHSWMQLESRNLEPVARLLATTVQQAQTLQDKRTEAHALVTLSKLYSQTGQTENAQTLSRQALLLAQSVNAPDIAYLAHWQLGRSLKQQGDQPGAITAYDAAVSELQTLRSDLVAVDRSVQFSFKESVEPVYRESVELLLQSQNQQPSAQILDKARQRIELLQLAELDNFFREACLNTQTVLLDKVVDQDNPTAAIVYPIILPDQLQVIVKIPRQPLRHYAVQKSQTEIEQVLADLRQNLAEPDTTEEVKVLSQQVYDWLIRPIAADLEQREVKTLVFVLDGALRSVPMSVLYDGKQYLVEKYAVALSLGLQLIQPKPITDERLNVLAAGLVQPPPSFQQFPPLPEITSEMNFIAESGVSTKQLLNQKFTGQALKTAVNSTPFNVVHLATHGQFSSQASETFILAADGPINVTQLDELLRNREQTQTTDPIELLVLSACQTAAGDNRATLGLAGVAVRAGARSTVASLWQLDDRATAIFVKEFYRALAKAKITKAEALREAQLALLTQYPNYDRPGFWAPYVLVGNWL